MVSEAAQNSMAAYIDTIVADARADERRKIAQQVRNNCTLPWPPPVSIDTVITAVADWIDNPPEWVTKK